MEQQKKIVTLNPSYDANQGIGSYPSDFPMEDGYKRATGIAIVNTGAHTKFDVGVNDHNNNIKLDPTDISFWAPGQNGDQKFIPIDIPLSGNKLKVMTSVRVSEANAIGYQVILQIEK